MRRSLLALTCASALLVTSHSTASADPPDTADVMDQGEGAVYSPDGARLVRQPNGLAVSIKMPTPAAGTYVYPEGTEPGHPEVFTLWAFVFNHPDQCSGPCGPDDLTDPEVGFGVYNAAGHAVSGSTLELSGRFGVGDPAMAPPGITPFPLSNPAGAEVHVAVTSHGGLDPSTLPGEFHTPTGSPACGCWWVAVFD